MLKQLNNSLSSVRDRQLGLCLRSLSSHGKLGLDGKPELQMAHTQKTFSNCSNIWKEVVHSHGRYSGINSITGIDLVPGREGGTWIGISKTARVGMLTNYRQSSHFIKRRARGRGGLVTNFLVSDDRPWDYVKNVRDVGHEYNGFNLIVGDLSVAGTPKFSYYCNQEHEPLQELPPGVYGVSNRYLDYPWRKVDVGKRRFAEIIQSKRTTNKKINLLLEMLQDKTRYPEDRLSWGPQDFGFPDHFILGCSATSVHIPEFPPCGTRTNTVIVVDANDHVTFVERTMKEPIDLKDIQWKTNTFTFKLCR